MQINFYQLPVYLIGLCIFVGLLISAIAGYQSRRRQETGHDKYHGEASGLVVGGILGLLGLVLAFTYSYNLTRHEARQTAAVSEANALGTVFLRADLLPAAQRQAFQTAVLDYSETRLFDHVQRDPSALTAALEATMSAQAVLWPMALAFSTEHMTPPERNFLLGAVNDVLDIHSVRVAVGNERMPYVVIIFAVGIGLIAFYMTGYMSGSKPGFPMLLIGTYALVVAGTFSLIMDFDQARSGMIQLDNTVLAATVDDMTRRLAETQ